MLQGDCEEVGGAEEGGVGQAVLAVGVGGFVGAGAGEGGGAGDEEGGRVGGLGDVLGVHGWVLSRYVRFIRGYRTLGTVLAVGLGALCVRDL